MGVFTYDVNDPEDRIGQIVSKASQISRPDIAKVHEAAKQLRQYHWENRRITSHGTYFGGKEYQWLAHIPQHVAELLDFRHPGWDSDEQTMREVLANYPECRVLPEETR